MEASASSRGAHRPDPDYYSNLAKPPAVSLKLASDLAVRGKSISDAGATQNAELLVVINGDELQRCPKNEAISFRDGDGRSSATAPAPITRLFVSTCRRHTLVQTKQIDYFYLSSGAKAAVIVPKKKNALSS